MGSTAEIGTVLFGVTRQSVLRLLFSLCSGFWAAAAVNGEPLRDLYRSLATSGDVFDLMEFLERKESL